MSPLINGHRQPRNSRLFKQWRDKRVAELAKFPIGRKISYKWDNEDLGTVIEHDAVNGRVASRGGSFDPFDIKLYEG